MVEWIDTNKEWFFSGVGVAATLGLLTLVRFTYTVLSKKTPIVDVKRAFGLTPMTGPKECIAICFLNPTERPIRIGNFLIELADGKTIYTPADGLTNRPQGPQIVLPGDRSTYYVPVDEIREHANIPLEHFKCALVEDALGGKHRSKGNVLKRIIATSRHAA